MIDFTVAVLVDALVIGGELSKAQADKAIQYIQGIPLSLTFEEYLSWRETHVK